MPSTFEISEVDSARRAVMVRAAAAVGGLTLLPAVAAPAVSGALPSPDSAGGMSVNAGQEPPLFDGEVAVSMHG